MLYVDYVAPVFPGGSYVNVQRGSYFKILFQYLDSWKKIGSINLESIWLIWSISSTWSIEEPRKARQARKIMVYFIYLVIWFLVYGSMEPLAPSFGLLPILFPNRKALFFPEVD
jgi:hypothetical protein